MKYMLLFCKTQEDDRHFDQSSDEEKGRLFARVAEWQAEYKSSFVEQGYRLARAHAATTLRRRGDKIIVTDGPFVEGAEVVGGYSIVDVPDLDHALRIARDFPACPIVEVRPVLE